jgi:hypothetical protein
MTLNNVQEDLSGMILALDAGERVNIEAIKDPRRKQFFRAVFSHMPIDSDPLHGIVRSRSCLSIRKYFLTKLVSGKDVIEPAKLDSAQALATRAGPLLQGLVLKFPALLSELAPMISSVAHGEAVSLSGLQDVELREGLARLLRAAGAVESAEEEETLCLPPPAGKGILAKDVQGALRYLTVLVDAVSFKMGGGTKVTTSISGYKSAAECDPMNHNNQGEEDDDAASTASSSSSSSCSSSSSASSSTSIRLSTTHSNRTIVGPSRPTDAQLRQAASYRPLDASDEEEEDSSGPRPSMVLSDGRGQEEAVPLGGVLFRPQAEERSLPPSDSAYPAETAPKREEWMTTPGERKVFGGAEEAFGAQRKFNMGKEAKKAAALLNAQREMREAQPKSVEEEEEERRTEAILQEYREKRGPSLMEAHLDQVSKKPKLSSRQKNFDYDRVRLHRETLYRIVFSIC